MPLHKILIFIACVFMAHPAEAHPHIFVKYDVVITQKDSNTLGLHFTFKIHNVITQNPLFHDLQINNLFDALHQHPFYLFLDLDGHPLAQRNVEMTRHGGTDLEPIYTFDMDIPSATATFGFSIYDPEYYDSVLLDGSDAMSVEINKLSCLAERQAAGKTMWGINYATHVECADKSQSPPHLNAHNKVPMGEQSPDAASTNHEELLP